VNFPAGHARPWRDDVSGRNLRIGEAINRAAMVPARVCAARAVRGVLRGGAVRVRSEERNEIRAPQSSAPRRRSRRQMRRLYTRCQRSRSKCRGCPRGMSSARKMEGRCREEQSGGVEGSGLHGSRRSSGRGVARRCVRGRVVACRVVARGEETQLGAWRAPRAEPRRRSRPRRSARGRRHEHKHDSPGLDHWRNPYVLSSLLA
jgi:hypothetical protein